MRFAPIHAPRRLVSTLAVLLLVFALAPISSGATLTSTHSTSGTLATTHGRRPPRLVPRVPNGGPTDTQCRQQLGIPCYSPQEMQRAYGLTPILNAGFNGAGQTIIIVDSFGSPTIAQDLAAFDAGYGLPDPPSFQVLAPLGSVQYDPNNPDMVGWAIETTLDVEWAHAMAPGASIVLLTSPIAETEGVQGMPEFLELERYALDNNLGQIISQSWGATENTLFTPGGQAVFAGFDALYRRAASQHVTVLASSGDSGVANVDVNGNFYPFPTVIFPASSPWVTAVGGTTLMASIHGDYQSEVVWNGGQPSGGASGGGVSQVWAEPAYQTQILPASDQTILNGYRGLPDVAYNADPATSVVIYLSFAPYVPGFYVGIGGTSEGAPQWAGIIADGNQMAGRPLGFLNPALYALAHRPNGAGLVHDVTQGNNGQENLPGYNATSGWDLTTGWGSPKAASLLQALIAFQRTSQ